MDKVPDSFEELLSTITPEVHAKLKQAIELGRWENGDRLSKEQVELCMQAVIAYEMANALIEKFGGDTLDEMKRNFEAYQEYVRSF